MIENRPDVVDSREEFGHWEIDTVAGLRSDKDQALLTLTERKTRYEVIIKIDGKASNSVNQALSTLREAAGRTLNCSLRRLPPTMALSFQALRSS
ncbi:hypothetical protein ABW365_12075 [Enterococcus avium]